MNFHPEAVRRAIRFATSYSNTSGITAGTADQVFTAASNTGGAVVWRASLLASVATPFSIELTSKATAPTGVGQGVSLLLGDNCAQINATPTYAIAGKLEVAVWVPAGLGLYFISTGTDSALAGRQVWYTLIS